MNDIFSFNQSAYRLFSIPSFFGGFILVPLPISFEGTNTLHEFFDDSIDTLLEGVSSQSFLLSSSQALWVVDLPIGRNRTITWSS